MVNKKIALISASLTFVLIFIASCQYDSQIGHGSKYTVPPENFKVAFIGDQGLGENARAVLHLIKDENADMILHQGDFDYEDNPLEWESQIDDIFGPTFPYFASIGNHDLQVWPVYQKKLQDRVNRIKEAKCEGDLGVKSYCIYKGIFFVLSGAGTKDSEHDKYIERQLNKTNLTWRICSWHKNQRLMQVGGKLDETGWDVYDECRSGGAIIATGHEHSYSRTHLMESFEEQIVASTSNMLEIEKGKTFAFVSGLGGRSIRSQIDELASKPWWAAVYTAKQDANYGALFCIFNANGIENTAYCYFENIDGKIIDKFNIKSKLFK